MRVERGMVEQKFQLILQDAVIFFNLTLELGQDLDLDLDLDHICN